MHNLRTMEIAKINDSITFEHLCRDLWKNNSLNNQVQLNGRPGQTQDGVDVFGRYKESGKWFGIQCKVRKDDNLLTKSDIQKEIAKALNFNPELCEYIICTTLSRNVKIQNVIRELNDELFKEKKFDLSILFWDDMQELLKSENNFVVCHKYFNAFFANNETLGHAVGKLINLELGIGKQLDTHYEIMIGKVPKEEDGKNTDVSYYKGTYFMINYHERKMETFPIPCFDSDLEQAFSNPFDRFRITKWINSIESIDDFIYECEDSIHAFLSEEEYSERIKYLEENM